MSTASKLEPLAIEAVGIAKHVADLVRQGLKREAVLERLADPAGVAAKLIDDAIERKAAGAAYLGRDPAPVMARVETGAEDTVKIPRSAKPLPRSRQG